MLEEQLFSVANTIALLSWLLLAVLPGRRWVTDVMTGKVSPDGLRGSLRRHRGDDAPRRGGWLLDAERSRVALRESVAAACRLGACYLAFDLLIGTWEARDARASVDSPSCSSHACSSPSCWVPPAGCST